MQRTTIYKVRAAGRLALIALLALVILGALADHARAARLKDIINIQGVRNNQLIGYGLVVGLQKTGDDQMILFTVQSLTSMLSRMGVKVDPTDIRARNVAAVMVTATLPPFATIGNTLDIQISSIGNAKSLLGGTLLMTPLRGADGEVYAMAQGSLIIGGYAFAGAGGTSIQKNHPTVGRIPGGAIIEREVKVDINTRSRIVLSLFGEDFTTASRVAEVINQFLSGPYAKANNSRSVTVQVPAEYQSKVVGLIARIENLQVQTDRRAKVVLNERTGTVVMGADVRISTIAISHGSLKIHISARRTVSQPQPFAAGRTVVTPESEIQAVEEGGGLLIVNEGVSIGDVVMALNAIGVTPRDLIDILQAIKAAGALEADMVIL